MTMHRLLLSCFLLAAALAVAADSNLQGPIAGFVMDSRSHSIRPVQGLPGSMTLGSPLDIPFGVDRAVFAGQKDLAVVFGAGGVYLVRGMRQSSPEVLPLPVSIADPVAAVFNATGSAAVVYSQRQLQVVSGLAAEPAVGPTIDCSAAPGSITSAALDRDASSVLVALEDSGAGAVLLLRADATSPRFLLTTPSPSAVVYLNQDHDALVADRSSNAIFLVRDLKGSADVILKADGHDGISTPVGLQLSADEQTMFVANAGSNCITAHSLAGPAAVAQFPMPAAPARFDRLNRESVLISSEFGSGPLYLLDEAGGRRVYFIPVD